MLKFFDNKLCKFFTFEVDGIEYKLVTNNYNNKYSVCLYHNKDGKTIIDKVKDDIKDYIIDTAEIVVIDFLISLQEKGIDVSKYISKPIKYLSIDLDRDRYRMIDYKIGECYFIDLYGNESKGVYKSGQIYIDGMIDKISKFNDYFNNYSYYRNGDHNLLILCMDEKVFEEKVKKELKEKADECDRDRKKDNESIETILNKKKRYESYLNKIK